MDLPRREAVRTDIYVQFLFSVKAYFQALLV